MAKARRTNSVVLLTPPPPTPKAGARPQRAGATGTPRRSCTCAGRRRHGRGVLGAVGELERHEEVIDITVPMGDHGGPLPAVATVAARIMAVFADPAVLAAAAVGEGVLVHQWRIRSRTALLLRLQLQGEDEVINLVVVYAIAVAGIRSVGLHRGQSPRKVLVVLLGPSPRRLCGAGGGAMAAARNAAVTQRPGSNIGCLVLAEKPGDPIVFIGWREALHSAAPFWRPRRGRLPLPRPPQAEVGGGTRRRRCNVLTGTRGVLVGPDECRR
mmetsp:Transcript_35420/g.99033  ORF Transcript_35420/g.99033 Transcript_35420/m.99033 type:complete len:270 (-) Transcript_35420:286-1095(-)